MSDDPSPLKYMGTQSHETMAMEAAMVQRSVRSIEQSAAIAAKSTVVGDATDWAIAKAKDTLRAAVGYVGERATTTLKTYIGQDPMRAMLIAAGTGAVLMGLVTMMARSGARSVGRNIRRHREARLD